MPISPAQLEALPWAPFSTPYPLQKNPENSVLWLWPKTMPKILPQHESTLGYVIIMHPYRVFKPPPLEKPCDFSPVPFPESHLGVLCSD